MIDKIIISKSKPNYFTIALGLLLFYFAYDYFQRGALVLGFLVVAIGLISLVHTLLLLTTPLLIHQDEYLIVKPKIPFEKKTLHIDELKELKVNSESELSLIMKNGAKIKLDLGGFKKNEIGEIRTYLLGVMK